MSALAGCVGVLSPTKVHRAASGILPGETGEQAWLRGLREAQPWRDPGPGGVTYLLHFEAAYWHARHYTGWTDDLSRRLRIHRAGRGANLIRVITDAGITFQLARVWPETTRNWEAKLKRRGGATRHCPICNPATALRCAQVPTGKFAKHFRPAGYDARKAENAMAAVFLMPTERAAVISPLLEVTA